MAVRDLSIVRVRAGQWSDGRDQVVVEAPLEIRVHGRPFAVVMRTPGADRELAAGFLFAERVIETPDHLGTIEFCQDADDISAGVDAITAVGRAVNVTLSGASSDDVERRLAERRDVVASAACGVCGRLTIETLARGLEPLALSFVVAAGELISLSARLREAQPLFDVTGGLHAAGLFDRNARLVTSAEDVGRHNAVDKVVGRMLMREQLPLTDHMLFVSGRTSFEIVQKAWCAGVPVLASVSAPSSLAIDLAIHAGITLVGFARDGGFNIYAHPSRIGAS